MSRTTRRRLSLAVGVPLVAVLWLLPLVLALLPAEASTSEIGMALGAGEFHVVALHSLDRRASALPSLPSPEEEPLAPAFAFVDATGPALGRPAAPEPLASRAGPPGDESARGVRLLS